MASRPWAGPPALAQADRPGAAKELIDAAKATLSGARRSAIGEMLVGMTYKEAAAALGVSVAAINTAVTERRAAARARRAPRPARGPESRGGPEWPPEPSPGAGGAPPR